MKNNAINERNERIFDAMLKIAADEALREEMAALPSDEELLRMYPSTESLDRKAYAVIKKEFRVINRRKALRLLSRVAAVFCIIAVLSTGVLMVTPASRNFILNFLVDIRYDHVAFDFGLEDIPDINGDAAVFRYAPEGFVLVTSHTLETLITYVFENDEGYVLIAQRFLGRSLAAGLDNEYAHFSEVQLNAGVAHISVAQDEHDFSTIMWADGEDVISISTTFSVEILLEMAEIYMKHR